MLCELIPIYQSSFTVVGRTKEKKKEPTYLLQNTWVTKNIINRLWSVVIIPLLRLEAGALAYAGLQKKQLLLFFSIHIFLCRQIIVVCAGAKKIFFSADRRPLDISLTFRSIAVSQDSQSCFALVVAQKVRDKVSKNFPLARVVAAIFFRGAN